MKLKDDFVLRQVADTWIILPLSTVADFKSILQLNESGALLWKALEQGKDPVAALTAEYDVSWEQAAVDVKEFLAKLQTAGCLED